MARPPQESTKIEQSVRETSRQCGDSLVHSLAADLDTSFEDLVRAYQDRLYGFALRLTGSPRDAEEAAQDAFVRAYRALHGYEPERVRALALKPWLYQIALNVCRNRLRKRRVASVPLDAGEGEEESMDLPADSSQQPEALFEEVEERKRLAQMVGALPERYRVAVVLRFVQDLTYAEAAEVLGQPVGTVKSNVHRGIKLLQTALAEAERTEASDGRNANE